MNVSSHSSSRDVLDLLEAGLMRGVVDENIDAAELADRLVHDRPAMRGVLDVAREQDGFAAGVLDQALGLLGVLMLAEIGDQHVGALARKRKRHRAADAAVAAGDDRLFAGQPPRAFVGLLAVIGDGLHLLGEARHRLLLFGEWRLRIIDHAVPSRFLIDALGRRRRSASRSSNRARDIRFPETTVASDSRTRGDTLRCHRRTLSGPGPVKAGGWSRHAV